MAKRRLYLCWSKGLGRLIAGEFRSWIKANMGTWVQPFFSELDIEGGELWSERIMGELARTRRGIVFVTREMADAPFVMFEAGALAKEFKQARVVPVLVDILPSELPGALKMLQGKAFDHDEILRVLLKLVPGISKDTRKHARLALAFHTWWPKLTKRANQYRQQTAEGHGDWSLVSPAKVAGEVTGSPFVAQTALRIAETQVIFVGQNLFFLIGGVVDRIDSKGLWGKSVV